MTSNGPVPADWQTPTIEALTGAESTPDATAPARNGFISSLNV